MDRIASLVLRASEIQRRIYRSLPFGIRLAIFFTKLADTPDAFGRYIGAKFLLAGVDDMPDPGPRWNPRYSHPELTLPQGYMKPFASGAYRFMLRRFNSDLELVESAFSNVMMKFVEDKVHVDPGPRVRAEGLVRKMLLNAGLDIIRARESRPTPDVSLSDPGEGDEGRGTALIHKLDDPQALHDMQRDLSPRVWKALMRTLAREIDQDIPQYIALAMQGYNNTEIIGHPGKGFPGMLDHYRPPPTGPNAYAWLKVRHIPEVARKFFQSIGEEGFAPV